MKIAIVKLSAMGDIIHTMVVLEFIKKAYPNIIIDWIVEESFSPILAHNPHIDNILPINLKSIKKDKKLIFREIKRVREYAKNSYDLVIDAQGLIKSAIVSRLLSQKIVGFDKESIRESLASIFYTKKVTIGYEKNVIDRNITLISNALDIDDIDVLNKSPFLFYTSIQKADIVFIVGASTLNKIYPKENFLEVAKGLKGREISVVWANEDEKEVAEFLEDKLDYVKSLSLSLDGLKSLISNASLIIGGDTGPTHIAWGVNTPSITLFGNTPHHRNTYITDVNRVIHSNSKVNPLKLDKSDFSIKDIDPKEIIKVAKELLDD